METELSKQVKQAVKLLEKLYAESDHLKWTYLRYSNLKDQLESTNKKSLYAAAMTILLLSGLISNLRLKYRFSTRLWLGFLAAIVVLGIFIGIYSSKRGKQKSTREFESAKEEYETAVKPFLDQIQASADLKLLPEQYHYPIAASYILNCLETGTETVEAAAQEFETYYDDLAGQSDHEEFRKTKEQAKSVRMFYPDLEMEEKEERASKGGAT